MLKDNACQCPSEPGRWLGITLETEVDLLSNNHSDRERYTQIHGTAGNKS